MKEEQPPTAKNPCKTSLAAAILKKDGCSTRTVSFYHGHALLVKAHDKMGRAVSFEIDERESND